MRRSILAGVLPLPKEIHDVQWISGELAMVCMGRSLFVSGGYDRVIGNALFPGASEAIVQDGIIGSVQWPLCNRNVCPSLTLDNGTFLIYDVQQRPLGPPRSKRP